MFLDTIHSMIGTFNLSITVAKNDDDTLTIMMVPKPTAEKADSKDKVTIMPLTATGSLEYFNGQEFANDLKAALSETAEKMSNINLYIKSVDEAEKKKAKDAGSKKPDKAKKEEKKEDGPTQKPLI